MLYCSRHTVRDVLQAAFDCNISWPLDENVTNADLEEIMFPSKYKWDSRYAEPDYPYVHRELVKPGVTLTLL